METQYLKQFMSLVIGLSLFQVANAQLPEPGFEIDKKTAIVITDPQVDFLSTKGVAWGAVGESVVANNTIANIETLFKLGKQYNIQIFVSPHYYYPHDHTWKFEGVLEVLMHNIKMFDRSDQLSSKGFVNSGADWMPQYKKYIEKPGVTVSGPHKVYGPESNDLALQLRKQGFDKIILGGMSGNLCAESHMRELIENGFEVAVVGDATASAILPGLDGNLAAQTNFKLIASKVYTTKELVAELAK